MSYYIYPVVGVLLCILLMIFMQTGFKKERLKQYFKNYFSSVSKTFGILLLCFIVIVATGTIVSFIIAFIY